VATVLTADWFARNNARLAAATSRSLTAPEGSVTVVFELTDSPEGEPESLTFLLSDGEASIVPGGHDPADVVVRLSFDDAVALAEGHVNGGRALRDGRLKVRGDTDALNQFGAWIVATQSTAVDEAT
jgi:hypothetical protein